MIAISVAARQGKRERQASHRSHQTHTRTRTHTQLIMVRPSIHTPRHATGTTNVNSHHTLTPSHPLLTPRDRAITFLLPPHLTPPRSGLASIHLPRER
mmetsp:Transcript_47297/g.118090  ORF Transcript_47297/g.118090 Transcript_47297/m.118090 type:complete len:98 (-) Transcript_47297:91-384(-)